MKLAPRSVHSWRSQECLGLSLLVLLVVVPMHLVP